MCQDVLVRDSDGQHCAPSELSILQQLEAVVLVPNYNRLMPSGRTFLNFFNNANCAAAAKRLACWVLLSSTISYHDFPCTFCFKHFNLSLSLRTHFKIRRFCTLFLETKNNNWKSTHLILSQPTSSTLDKHVHKIDVRMYLMLTLVLFKLIASIWLSLPCSLSSAINYITFVIWRILDNVLCD